VVGSCVEPSQAAWVRCTTGVRCRWRRSKNVAANRKTGGGEDRPSVAREGFVPTGTRSLVHAPQCDSKARGVTDPAASSSPRSVSDLSSVFGGALDLVDDEDLDRSACRLKFETELFLQRGED